MKKTVFITGTSSGIGKAAVQLFSDNGWNVAATMRNPQNDTELAQMPGVKLYALDVTQPESVKMAIGNAIADFGNIDVLINNAGYGLAGPLETASEEKIMQQFQTNVFGVMRTIQSVVPHMREHNGGVIVNITSIGGLVTFPFNSIYHATKFALDGMTESLNYELNPFNIQAKVVAPGGVSTDFAGRSLVFTTEPGQQTVYDSAIEQVMTAFSERAANRSTAMHIAETIYAAATDGTKQIRYVAGTDARQTYGAWKQMNNEDFFEMVKTNFGV